MPDSTAHAVEEEGPGWHEEVTTFSDTKPQFIWVADERCGYCEGPTQRTGSCRTCIVCGSTTGCG